jgi:hypothetical protein
LEIISSDWFSSENMSSFPLLPGDTPQDAQIQLGNNVYGYREGGLESVQGFMNANLDAYQWLRPDAALLIVFVSDEDDWSVQDFITWVSLQRDAVYVSAIVNVDPSISECPNTYNHAQDVGHRYMDVANFFGGIIIDICAEDWTQGVAQASQQLQLVEEIALDHVPVSDQHIEVFVDGAIWVDWIYDSATNIIKFTVVPPEESLIEVVYNYQ